MGMTELEQALAPLVHMRDNCDHRALTMDEIDRILAQLPMLYSGVGHALDYAELSAEERGWVIAYIREIEGNTAAGLPRKDL